MRANVDVLSYNDRDRAVKLLHSLMVNELFSKLKSADVDRGMTAKLESPTDSHSLALIGGSGAMSRPSLLGACTPCPVLHGKVDDMHAYTISLEPKLKESVRTSCSTCELHALQNLELAHYVDRLQDENDELRKMMGWFSGHEPQVRMMIEAYRCYEGQALGDKIGECSGEGGEKIGDIQASPKTFHKNA
jgi:hypothetical protein